MFAKLVIVDGLAFIGLWSRGDNLLPMSIFYSLFGGGLTANIFLVLFGTTSVFTL